MVVSSEQNVGKLTLENLKKYDLLSAVNNIAKAWNDVSTSTLASGWNRLLRSTNPMMDIEGGQVSDFHSQLVQAGEKAGSTLTEEDVEDWLECDEGDPGMQVMTEEQITHEVLHS